MSKETRRFYWIRLPVFFFNDIAIKKMRKQSKGEFYQIIYIKMLLLACNSNGVIVFQGVYDSLYEEIAEQINEQDDIVKNAIQYFEKNNLIEYRNKDIFISQSVLLTGSECLSAERVREFRKRIDNNTPSLQCNTKSLQCNTPSLQCNTPSLQCNTNVTKCNVEKEKEKDIDIEKDFFYDQAPQKRAFGKNKNILLSDQEYIKLCDEYTKHIVNMIIDNISEHISAKNGTGYGNKTYMTIEKWINDYINQNGIDIKEKKEKSKRLKELENRYLNGEV